MEIENNQSGFECTWEFSIRIPTINGTYVAFEEGSKGKDADKALTAFKGVI